MAPSRAEQGEPQGVISTCALWLALCAAPAVVAWVDVAQVVPAGARPLGHCARLPPRRPACRQQRQGAACAGRQCDLAPRSSTAPGAEQLCSAPPSLAPAAPGGLCRALQLPPGQTSAKPASQPHPPVPAGPPAHHPPVAGSVAATHSAALASGGSGVPEGLKSAISGSVSGRSDSEMGAGSCSVRGQAGARHGGQWAGLGGAHADAGRAGLWGACGAWPVACAQPGRSA